MITMRKIWAYAAAALAAVALLAGCSSPEQSDASGPSTSASSEPVVTISSITSPPATAGQATTEACRALADDKELAAFWHDINNTGTTTGARGMLAGQAIMNLGLYSSNPAVDPTVSASMITAVTEMGNMNTEIADGVAKFDVQRFKEIITPVVNACMAAGVDMAVTE